MKNGEGKNEGLESEAWHGSKGGQSDMAWCGWKSIVVIVSCCCNNSWGLFCFVLFCLGICFFCWWGVETNNTQHMWYLVNRLFDDRCLRTIIERRSRLIRS